MKNYKKPKIVFAVNDFTVAGAQRLYVDLFKKFQSLDYEIFLFTLFQFGDKNDFYSLVPKNIKVFKMSFKNFYDIGVWLKLFFVLFKIRPDVVISSLFFSNTVFRILKSVFFYKIITIEHNTYIHKSRLEIFIDKILSFFTFKIVAVSSSVLNFTAKQEIIPKSKFVVIHNGLDFQKLDEDIKKGVERDTLKRELGFDKKDKIIINVGRLTYQKNQEALIRAFSTFVKKHDDYKLIILGEGNLKNTFSDLIKILGVENQIKLLGSKTDIIPYYLLSDYFVSTSVIEGFGLAHAEALYCGLPVLTTKTAGPDEFVKEGENGYFMGKSEEDIIVGFEKMYHNADFSKMKLNAKNSIKNFSIENTTRLYKELIDDCLR